MQRQRIRWNRIVILIAGVAILCGLCAGIWALAPNIRRGLFSMFWKTDPQQAAQAAQKMLDYDLPPGYQELRVLNIQGEYAAVMIVHRERPSDAIFIGGLTDGIIDNDQWRANYERGLAREMGDRLLNMREIGTQETTVRGQPTTIRYFEGTDESGRQVKQAICAFAGKGKDLLMGIVASQETWDQAIVDGFLQSIR